MKICVRPGQIVATGTGFDSRLGCRRPMYLRGYLGGAGPELHWFWLIGDIEIDAFGPITFATEPDCVAQALAAGRQAFGFRSAAEARAAVRAAKKRAARRLRAVRKPRRSMTCR